jgi:hypothetical protein
VTAAESPSLLAPCLHALRRNLWPGLVLQIAALSVIVAYTSLPAVHASLDAIGALKDRLGFAYSVLSTATFGGLIPFAVLFATGRVPRGRQYGELMFYLLFWAIKGFEIDALYRLQTVLFGEAQTVWVIASKVCVDQFVYNPLWAAPIQAIFFLWKDCNFSTKELRLRLHEESLTRRVLVVLVSTWLVWIPAVAIIYTLPTALQLPLSNLVLCFWCLLVSFISRQSTQQETSPSGAIPLK